MRSTVLAVRERCSAARSTFTPRKPLFLRGHAKVAIPFSPPLALAQRIILFPLKKQSIFSFHRKLETYLETFAFSEQVNASALFFSTSYAYKLVLWSITAAFKNLQFH